MLDGRSRTRRRLTVATISAVVLTVMFAWVSFLGWLVVEAFEWLLD